MEMTLETIIQMQTMAKDAVYEAAKTMIRAEAVVILTQTGNVYCHCASWEDRAATEDRIVAELAEKKDTAVSLVAFMWKEGLSEGMVHAPVSLQKKLLALNEANRQTWLYMPTVQTIRTVLSME